MGKLLIIDYGMGNIRSVQKAVERIGVTPVISSDPSDIINADKIILPGVGNFTKGMHNLNEKGWINPLREKILEKKAPILGICLGMQLLTKFSEEGNIEGLSMVNAKTQKFVFQNKILKIPHMGWNLIEQSRDSILFNGIKKNEAFMYFVHSYYVRCERDEDISAETEYGIRFVSAFQFDNIFGVQFHPEKSHEAGLKLISNFIHL